MIGRYLLLGCALLSAQTSSPTEARDYERFTGRWNRQLAPELIRFAALTETGKLLDYGCTTGATALRLAARFKQSEVTGVDPSEAFIAFARIQAPRATVHFQTADLIHLPFPNGQFDATLSLHTIGTVAEPQRAIAEMRRVTKPEGIVATAVWDYGPGMPALQMFWDAAVAVAPALAPGDGPNTPFSKKGQLAALWTEAGLRDVVEQLIEVDLSFNSFEDYWAPFLTGQGSAGAWLAAQPQETRSAVRERLRAKIVGSRADGPFTVRVRAWAVKGVVRYQ